MGREGSHRSHGGNRGTGRTTILASGRHVFRAAGKAKVVVKLTSNGKKRLKHSRKLRATLKVTFKPTGGKAISSTVSVRLKR